MLRLSGRLLALPLGTVREVAPYCSLGRPPASPPLLEGLLNLRGETIPVLRLDRLLGLPDITVGLSSLLIVTTLAGGLALLVEEALEIVAMEAQKRLPVSPAETFNGCVQAQAEYASDPLYLLDPQRLILTREEEAIRHFSSLGRRRAGLIFGGNP